MAYAAWLGGMLPRDADWSLAALGGGSRSWPWGDAPPPGGAAGGEEACRFALHRPCSGRELRPVMSAPAGATPDSIYDLVGSVWEWLGDAPEAPDSGVAVAEGGPRRVLRGGSFAVGAAYLRPRARHDDAPGARSDDYGFRVIWRDGEAGR